MYANRAYFGLFGAQGLGHSMDSSRAVAGREDPEQLGGDLGDAEALHVLVAGAGKVLGSLQRAPLKGI